MMSTQLTKVLPLRLFCCRLASQAHDVKEGPLKPQPVKTTTLPSGLRITSYENYSPISRIAVSIKAGTRYENGDQLGIVHALRNAAGLSTQNSTIFGITRNIESVGGRLTATADREYITYVLENIRDFSDVNIRFLVDTIVHPAFKPWELKDYAFRQKTDLALLKENIPLRLLEDLHKSAFRGGLQNSLFTPEYRVGYYEHGELVQWVNDYYVTDRTAVVAIGVDHEELVRTVENQFTLNTAGKGSSGESRYGGGEIRTDVKSDLSYVAVASEGASAQNQKEQLALSLFQTALGTGSRVKYSSGTASRVGQVVSKETQNSFAVSGLNISYSDTGLFGFTAIAASTDIHKVVKAVVNELRNAAKGLTDKDLSTAKTVLKSNVLMSVENQDNLLSELILQTQNSGQVLTLKEFERAVDAISVQDIATVAARVLKGKGTMASVGKISNVPYLDEL